MAEALPPGIEEVLGHRFAEPARLREALTHRSTLAAGGRAGRGARARRGMGSNERLEFIGDRVLGLVVAEWLLERFPHEQEGELGRRHAQLVSRDALAAVADAMGLEAWLTLSPDALAAGVGQRVNVLADALEAVLGALYLDGGLAPVREVVRGRWETLLAGQAAPPKDAKTALQEWLLARGRPVPVYATVAASGPSHAPRFVMEAQAGPDAAQGEAGSKREAERLAAAALLARLEAAETGRRS